MKQTNNAIKFLMAQYRAIFRNANLKMFLAAATAAAAMAATSAQADVTDWTKLDKQTTEKVTIAAGADASNDKPFKVVLTQADNSIVNNAGDKASHTFVGKSGSITVSGTAAALTVGNAQSGGTVVQLSSFTNTEGTVTVAGSGAKAVSSINAETITIGDSKHSSNDKANVNVNAHGLLNATGTGDGKGLIITKGAKITVVEDASVTGQISMNDGNVILSGSKANAAFGSESSAISITGGTVEAAATKSGSIIGSSIVLSGGTIDAKGALTVQTAGEGKFEAKSGAIKIGNGQTLTLKGVSDISGAKITNDTGKLVIEGTATLADDSLVVSAKSGSTILHGKTANDTSTLKLSSKELASVMKGGLESSGAGIGVVQIVGDESTAIDLSSAGTNLIGDNGEFDTKLKTNDTSTLKIKGGTGSYTKNDTIDAKNKKITLYFDTLTVGKGDMVTLQSGSSLEVSKLLTVGSGADKATLKVVKGGLTLNGAEGKVAAKAIELAGDKAKEALFTVESGNWTVNALTLTKSGAASVKGNLTVGGALTITDANSTLEVAGGSVSTLGSGSVAVGNNAAANSIKLTSGTLKFDGGDVLSGKSVDASKLKADAISGDGGSIIEIKEETKWTAAEFKAFKGKFTGFNGIFKMENVDVAVSGDEVKLTDVVDGLQTNAYNEKTLVVGSGDTVNKSYSVGNVHIDADKNLELASGGSMFLNKADASGNFVAKKSGAGFVTAGVDFQGTKNNTLTLVGTGSIGAITTKDATSKGKLVIGKVDDKAPVAGVVTVVGGGIGADGKTLAEVDLFAGSSLNVKAGDVFADNLKLSDDTSLTVSGKVAVDTASIDNAIINVGSFSVADNKGANAFKFDEGNMNVTGTLSFGSGNTVTIGTAGDVTPPAPAPGPAAEGETVPPTPAPEPNLGTSAQVFAGKVEIKTGTTVFVDPDASVRTSLLVGKVLTDGTTDGKLAGSLAIGNNSAIAFGYDEQEFVSAMSNYMVDGKFSEASGIKNALVLNTPIIIDNGQYINVDSSLTAASGSADSFNLADGSALVVTKDALANGAAITFNKNNGSASGTVTATDKSSIRLEGGITLADTGMKLFDKATTTGAKSKVYGAAGLIDGTLNADGTVTLKANDEKLKEVRAVASSPVADLLVSYRDGEFARNAGAGLDFIQTSLLKDDFVAIDAAAHAATYAGAQVAAVAAVGSMAEAVGGRVGSMGIEASTIAATGSQANGGVWISPMYKSVEADGFEAQGASYGADVDLSGVAFGADTVNGNMRFGAVFNIGSGDAEGSGNGNGLKDEFDYYGFGMYSVMGFGNFAVVGDASLNVISHEVKGLGAKGSADTTAVTMGVTGQYTISNPAVDVTPHLGARFIRLDTDSYDLVAGGETLATTDFEVQNVFSVPLGVTLSKAFEMGGWSLAPSADLSITFNTGDTEVESNTYFTGTMDYGFTTEVLDEVTYGVAVGLAAQYGAFGTQIGINYTGSSNTDALGVNAQARYMF